jgi:hypothetical protein
MDVLGSVGMRTKRSCLARKKLSQILGTEAASRLKQGARAAKGPTRLVVASKVYWSPTGDAI